MDVNTREEIKEGGLTRRVEEQTAKIPSINWLGLAVGSMALSAATTLIFQRRVLGTFFGLWAPTLMIIGLYNKMVKMESKMDRSLMH